MPRQKSPESKSVTMSARFSAAETAEIDAARGTADRGAWLREAALAAVRKPAPPGSAATRKVREVPAARLAELRAKAAAADVEPVSDPAELARLGAEGHITQLAGERYAAGRKPRRDPKNCRHENMKLHRGYCPDCETMAVKR